MAISFRAEKGTPLTYSELDNNFGGYFYSASTDGQTVTLFYPAAPAVPVNSGSFTFNLIKGLQNAGSDRRISIFSGSSAIETRQGVFVDRSGSLGVGASESTVTLPYRLDVSGSIRATGTVFQASDERLKENITGIENASEIVNQIEGVYFNWNKGVDDRQVGVIAQQVKKVAPEVVSPDNNGYLNVAYSGIVPILVEAFKEQNEVIEKLEKRISALENK